MAIVKVYQSSVLFYIPEQDEWYAISVVSITDKKEKDIIAEIKDEVRFRWINPVGICVVVDEIDSEVIQAIKEL